MKWGEKYRDSRAFGLVARYSKIRLNNNTLCKGKSIKEEYDNSVGKWH